MPIYDTADEPMEWEMNQAPANPTSNLFVDADVVVTGHPMFDRAQPISSFDHDRVVAEDDHGKHFSTAPRSFSTKNAQAVPVFQRASDAFTAGNLELSFNPSQSNIAKIVGRQRGRQAITIWVPTSYVTPAGINVTTPNGVIVAETEDQVQVNGGGVQLNAGDSITIHAESSVYAGIIPGNATGYCQWLVEYNPVGGELGGQ
jgi:hypothetical protein